jgi:AraC family transcriptional regulator
VPVTMGSPRFRAWEGTGCSVTEVWFAAGDVLPPHTHDRPIFGVMLNGAFQSAIARRRLDCPAASVWVEPLAERHANFIGRTGARVLVVQPDPVRADLFEPFAEFLEEVQHLRHAGIAADARRIVAEIDIADSVSSFAIDGLVQTMLAVAMRMGDARRVHAAAPGWLLRAQEELHARFRERPSVGEIAASAGVHPSHLARSFRAHFRLTLGDYLRTLRAEWAAERIARSDVPLAEIAAAAGYSDQSHMTRELRRHLGARPGELRRRAREQRGVRGVPLPNGRG